MTLQTLDNGATLAVQRAKINANFTALADALAAVPGAYATPVAVTTLTPADAVLVDVGGQMHAISAAALLTSLGVADSALPAAGALSGADIVAITQGGTTARTTLSAIAAFVAAALGSTGSAPGAVTALATGTITSASIPLTWSAGSGGTATSWAVTLRTPSGSGSYTAATGTFGAGGGAITGVSAGTYDVQVTASNAYGASPVATLTGITVPAAGSAPTAITGLATGVVTATTIPIAYGGGSGATSWTVQARTPSGSGSYTTPSFAVAPSATGATISGLTAGGTYDILVTATNATGSVTATLTAVSTPSTTYTVTGYAANTVNATRDGATNLAYDGAAKRLVAAVSCMTGGYWTVAPDPSTAMQGWSNSATVPPPDGTVGANSNGDASINCMSAMTPQGGGNFSAGGAIVLAKGSGSGVSGNASAKWYYWIRPLNGAAQCMNPSGLTVTNA